MIDEKTVRYVSALARLHIDESRIDHFARNLADILHYVDKLNKCDVAAVKPTSHVLAVENVFRNDTVSPSLSREAALSIAVDQANGHFKVPKVIE